MSYYTNYGNLGTAIENSKEMLDTISPALKASRTAVSALDSKARVAAEGKGHASPNPFGRMYESGFGYIFGKPLAYHPRTDPNQRIYQTTMLRNNTIMNIVPGIPYQDSEMMAGAREITQKYYDKIDELRIKKSAAPEGKARLNLDKQIQKLSDEAQSKLLAKGYDLRYAGFKQDVAGFMAGLQLVINRVGTAVFGLGRGDTISKFITDSVGMSIKEDAKTRGFKVWVEKGSSISESIDNSYTQSILETTQKSASNAMKHLRFIGQGAGLSTANLSASDIISENEHMQATGQTANIMSRTLAGANFDFPQIFDESKFNRSYEISFRFMSPYGDDRSVLNNVLIPFLFLLTCSIPKQEGINGHTSPFILQVDAPGFFSCPMGIVTSFSFKKGGDEMMFNNRGLPLIIEGSMTISDLYSNMSLPLSYSQFSTNFGTSSFLNTIGGLSLYASVDPSLKTKATNWVKDGITSVLHPFNIINEEVFALQRYFGIN